MDYILASSNICTYIYILYICSEEILRSQSTTISQKQKSLLADLMVISRCQALVALLGSLLLGAQTGKETESTYQPTSL